MFTPEQRDHARQRLLEMAREDPRVVAGAVVGAEAAGRVDRWSDLDLTFGVSGEATVDEVVADWTGAVSDELEGIFLFDVWRGPTVYRVFLLPGNLQVDLSFTPIGQFGPLGPDFKLLFGEAVENRAREPTSRLAETPRQQFGLCVLYLLRARLGVERGNLEQAETYFRLAAELLDGDEANLPAPPTGPALLHAVQEAVALLLRDPGEERDLAETLEPQLRELTQPTLDAG
jgi:hypothetical protein